MKNVHIYSDFAQQVAEEFIRGSAIDPCLYEVAVRVVRDNNVLPGGEVDYPIHDALNWRVKRFCRKARSSLEAALLLNEDGTCWQAKLSHPLIDPKKQKERKYEAPVGNGARVYLPPIPLAIRQKISDRYAVKVPTEGSFWKWLEQHPELPVVPTEGAKKGLALLSLGFIPLVFYGVNSGYRRLLSSRELVLDVQRFAHPDRHFIFAFDQDLKNSTRRRVIVAMHRLGALLTQKRASVSIAGWHSEQGKGVDDLIAACGSAAWEEAYSQALPLHHWQIKKHLERQLSYPTSLKINTCDLSALKLTNVPSSGIIAISSAKGTGKTKLIQQLTANTPKVLAGGHRIALMRNLCTRLELNYKGDLDKVNGEFITGAGYTCRIGLCVDSLLSIDPQKFADCDLVLDEVVQVVRHLLSSSTCSREGKRPALLARFRELVRMAKRLIVADADLDNATLEYLQKLREDLQPVFLIRNTYVSTGYKVRFIESPDRAVAVEDLVERLRSLPVGKALFVSTDSKGTSKAISRLLVKEFSDKRVLLVNSETSGGEREREFIQTPDLVLKRGDYDVIICSPSVATGVSIESQGIIDAVYGIFSGASGTDADLAQALGRVREPVPRIVWCPKRGGNFSKVSHTTQLHELKAHLQQKSNVSVSLIRSNLREDTLETWGAYNWKQDPHLELYCRFAIAQNFAMYNLRDSLLIRLQFERNQVVIEHRKPDAALKAQLKLARQEQKELDAEELVKLEDLSYSEVQALEQKEGLSPEESKAVSKFYFKDFYCLEMLAVEDVLWDNEGRRRGELLSLEAQLHPGLSIERTVKDLEKQAVWSQGYCPWDLKTIELRRRLRSELGLDELIAKFSQNWQWTKYDLAPYAAKARTMAAQIKVALNFSISEKVSDVQLVHQLLAQLGVQIRQVQWSRSVPGHEGEKLRVYELDQDHWEKVQAILQRREEKRQRPQQLEAPANAGSPLDLTNLTSTGDPMTVHAHWLSPESLAEVREWLITAASDPVLKQEVLKFVPEAVVKLVEQN